ncbi:MAG: RrF2 family transcriptional regulator [Planctomycetota bacterium]|jgi:Rrf2 family protein
MLGLTKKTGYGLVALAHLARAEGELCSAREIADAHDVPVALLMNVLKELAAADFVESVRGSRGGYKLAREPSEVTMDDIVTALEGPVRLAECVRHGSEIDDHTTCELIDRCLAADPIHRVQRRIADCLKEVTLAELLGPSPMAAGVGEDKETVPHAAE